MGSSGSSGGSGSSGSGSSIGKVHVEAGLATGLGGSGNGVDKGLAPRGRYDAC